VGVANTALRLLWPTGKAHRLLGDGKKLMDGLGVGLDRVHDAARLVLDESIPFRALVTLPDWHEALGIPYDATLPIDSQRTRLDAVWSAVGGMTLNDLQEQVQKEFPGVYITEVSATGECGVAECGIAICNGQAGDYSPTYYDVTGEVNDDSELMRLGRILDHFAPAHLIANIIVDVLSITATSSEAGDCICGLGVAEGESGPLAPSFTGGAFASGTGAAGALLIAYPGEVIGGPTPVLTYQWQKNGANISGEISRFYVLPSPVIPGDIYTCEVTATNATGSATSETAGIVAAGVAPFISAAQAVLTGASTLTAYITATGTPDPAYAIQWRKDGTNISGATASTLAISAPGTYDFVVTATNSAGSYMKTSTAYVASAPSISRAFAEWLDDSTLVVYVDYYSNPSASVTYQWRKDGVNISGATSPIYHQSYIPTGSYTCAVTATNSVGTVTVISNALV
jgi:hypothetical protein